VPARLSGFGHSTVKNVRYTPFPTEDHVEIPAAPSWRVRQRCLLRRTPVRMPCLVKTHPGWRFADSKVTLVNTATGVPVQPHHRHDGTATFTPICLGFYRVEVAKPRLSADHAWNDISVKCRRAEAGGCELASPRSVPRSSLRIGRKSYSSEDGSVGTGDRWQSAVELPLAAPALHGTCAGWCLALRRARFDPTNARGGWFCRQCNYQTQNNFRGGVDKPTRGRPTRKSLSSGRLCNFARCDR